MKFYARANAACHGNRVKPTFDRIVTFVNEKRHMEISRETTSTRCLEGNPWNVIFLAICCLKEKTPSAIMKEIGVKLIILKWLKIVMTSSFHTSNKYFLFHLDDLSCAFCLTILSYLRLETCL